STPPHPYLHSFPTRRSSDLQEADRHPRVGHESVAEDRLARESRQHFRDDAHRGQDQDVDFGMAEEPEQVLPEQRVATPVGLEEVDRKSTRLNSSHEGISYAV